MLDVAPKRTKLIPLRLPVDKYFATLKFYPTQNHIATLVSKRVHNSFIHSGYFYSASSCPRLLRGAPDYNSDTETEITRQSTTAGNSEWRKCPWTLRGGHWVGFEPATLRMQGTEPTTEPPCPTIWIVVKTKTNVQGDFWLITSA